MKCILQVLLRYKNYSQKDNHIGGDHSWLISITQSCGTYAFNFHRSYMIHPQINPVDKLQIMIFVPSIYNVYVQFLKMNIMYSSGCYEQGVSVVSHSSNTILSQFCGEYDNFDMIYLVNTLNIQLYCHNDCSNSYLRIRYQPTRLLPIVPHKRIINSDNYRILFERNWLTNKVMFWIRAPFHNMIHLITGGNMENVTIFDGPSVKDKELKGIISSTFQILVWFLIYDSTVNICHTTVATPENLVFADMQTTVEISSVYRVYSAPKGFELSHVVVAGFYGEACNLGGVVFLRYDGSAGWDTIGPYCGTSFQKISVQNNLKSGVVIYSYGEVNISLCMTSSTKKCENFLMHMATGNLPFIAEVDGYHLGESIKKLTVLPKPWNYGNTDESLISLHLGNVKHDNTNGFQRLLDRRLITINILPDAKTFLSVFGCDWWIETSGMDIDIKGYLSEYLLSDKLDILAENVSITWKQNCSRFAYPIIVHFTEMSDKTTFVYREPQRPHSDFLFTNIDKKHTLEFPTLRINQTYHIRIRAHCKLVQIWEIAENNCMLAKVIFGADEGLAESVTLETSKPQRLPSGYKNVSSLTIKNYSPAKGNITQESCSLTLYATAYVRLLFRTGTNGITPVSPSLCWMYYTRRWYTIFTLSS